MGLRGDDRGQAVQVGAVLLLAIFVITLSLYQATVIPGENKQVEFNDYQDATADLADLRNAILRVASEDAQKGATIKAGSRYPARSLFVNPPPATGRLQTSPAANVTISNVESADGYENVGTYLTAEGNGLNVSTRAITFEPSYNELDVAPLVTTYGATYRSYDEPIVLTDQTLVRGNRITLVSVAGDLDARGYDAPLTVEPVSAHTRTISVSSEGDPLNLTIPTELSADEWEDRLLAGQMAPAGHVEAVTPGPRPGTVTVSLAAGETYELRLGRVEVRERSDSTVESAPEPRYVVNTVGKTVQTNNDGRVKLVVEARDRYNNPASNANVTFQSGVRWFEDRDGTNLTSSALVRTDADGRATVWFNATGKVGRIPVRALLGDRMDGSEPGDSSKIVRIDVVNTVTDSGSGGPSGEQAGRGLAILEDTTTAANSDTFTFTLRNTGDYPVNVTGYRLDYITKMASNGQIADGPDAITQVTINNSSRPDPASQVAVEGKSPHFFANDPLTLPADDTIEMNVQFDSNWSLGNKDALVISLAVYLEGDVVSTYTVFYINN